MGIRLEWEIEAERSTFRTGEDPNAARQRRRARFRLVLLVGLLLALFALGAVLINLRVRDLQRREEQFLRDVVDAEITNLRLGNFEAYLNLQRSADVAWMDTRQQAFDAYQSLIQSGSNVQLTGVIKALEIDALRARVHVEEIVDGVPYERVWFYFKYPDDGPDDDDNDGRPFNDAVERDEQIDGWRHVPPDYTFWGETDVLETPSVHITYRLVDERFARPVSEKLTEWLAMACSALNCNGVPQLQVRVVANENITLDWPLGTWAITIPSPYVERARADMPFSPDIQIETAVLVADRLITYVTAGMTPAEYTDAAFLREALISWLVGRFMLIDTGSHVMTSLATQYEERLIGQVAERLRADVQIRLLAETAGTASLDEMAIDWRDYFGWKLSVEQSLSLIRDQAAFLALYDVSDPDVLTTAYNRFDQNLPADRLEVGLVQSTAPSIQGLPQRMVTVLVGAPDAQQQIDVLFRLVDQQWLRAN